MNRRQKEILKYSLEEENRILHRLTEAYEGAAEDIRKKIEKLMESVPKLQSRIYQARFQKALRSNIDDVLNKLRNGTYKTLSDFLDSSYEDGFIASIYDMQGQGVPLIFPVDPDQMYRAVTLNSRLSKGLYTKLGFDIDALKKEIREELSRGIAAGKMIDDLAKAIDRRTSVGLGKAKRIARTEARRIQNEAAYDAQLKAKENGADVLKEWCAILDSKTRPDHRKLHGQRKELDEYFEVNGHRALHPSGFGIASEDINCRCVLLQRARWAVEDEEEAVKDTDAIVKKSEAKSFAGFKKEYYEVITKQHYKLFKNHVEVDRFFSGKSSLWIKELTEDQRAAIYAYTDEMAYDLNSFLRGVTSYTKEYEEVLLDMKNQLVSAISMFKLDTAVRTYRSIPKEYVIKGKNVKEIIGTVYVDLGFMSTSPAPDSEALQNPECIFEIDIPAGTFIGAYVKELSAVKREYEFLIQAGSRFKIYSVRQKDDILIVHMGLIEDGE